MVCPSCESVGEVPAPERCCFTFCSGDFDSLSLIADTAARIWSAVCKMIHNKFYMKKKKKSVSLKLFMCHWTRTHILAIITLLLQVCLAP